MRHLIGNLATVMALASSMAVAQQPDFLAGLEPYRPEH